MEKHIKIIKFMGRTDFDTLDSVIQVILFLLTLLGILTAPIFTLGCVLIHYNHEVLGVFAIVVSVLVGVFGKE